MNNTIKDAFWLNYIKLIRDDMIPYQWKVLHDEAGISIDKERNDDGIPSEKSNAIENFRIAAGQKGGHHYGWLFQDSDVYKWLESAANTYAIKSDQNLKEMMEEVVSLIEEAQDDDGYISTFYQIDAPELKFRRLFESHELYCAGHLIEASVAYFKATKDDRLIKVSSKLIACIQNAFGSEPGKINGADGHQEIELALIKLFELTGNDEYLQLSEWFLEVRGQDPDFYHKQLRENQLSGLDDRKVPNINTVYHQAHKPVLEQTEAVGHAVRLVYMATAMAEVAHYNKNDKMLVAAKKMWKNIVKKRMYITGGIGSTVLGEAFTFDYDLPNDTMYCETCASIGLMYFARAMMKNEMDSEYADVLERALYNTVISGMALDGKHFFYVNPLEVNPEASRKDPGKSHVKTTRPSWFGCACCPPNLARTITSLDQYIVTQSKEALFVHLYIDMEGTFNVGDQTVLVRQETKMPYEGEISLSITQVDKPFTVKLRVPKWAGNVSCKLNGEEVDLKETNGYLTVILDEDAEIELSLAMPILEWSSHPSVKENKGKVALQRGPFVYCVEEHDNEKDLHLYDLKETPEPVSMAHDILGKLVKLEGISEKTEIDNTWTDHLYQSDIEKIKTETKNLTFIPYHLWGNRSTGEMRVWIDRK